MGAHKDSAAFSRREIVDTGRRRRSALAPVEAISPEATPGSGHSLSARRGAVEGHSRERLEYPQHRPLDGAACRDPWPELLSTGQAGLRRFR
jgi:hypothetical protein